ncbi:hypothetical protein [Prosthecomicrobium hirschii]|uniref:hypothetical protein n=1 Tax=Prosthecodimorpha hirschii TaxID=665126 RepID=UPI0022207BBA|nr:hypothetical protein [Prosthecomicrobium hirschii]MCW1842230.1 hypothetical protein [Prosthecomicrobium hirschii]
MALHPAPRREPTYETGSPRVDVPLRYPFRIGRRRIAHIDLIPPTLDDLEVLRSLDGAGPREILAAMSDLDQDQVGLFRWPDVEAALEAARALLPPDLLPVRNSAPLIGTDPEASVASVASEAAPRIPALPTDLDDDETVLPTARADRLVDLVGVSMEGIEHG